MKEASIEWSDTYDGDSCSLLVVLEGRFDLYDRATGTRWSFAEQVARLVGCVRGTNQRPFDTEDGGGSDGYKMTFGISGMYKGRRFHLYDYRGDFTVHLGAEGAHDSVMQQDPAMADWFYDLYDRLCTEASTTDPVPFDAKVHYHRGVRLRWPE